MDLEIYSKKANGQINIPPSKSVSHRAIICACLAKGRSIIKNVNLCEDVKNTINILREFVPIKIDGTTLTIDGGMKSFGGGEFVINESATTLRMLTPLLSYYSNSGVAIKTGEKLYKRGIKELEKLYNKSNKKINDEIHDPIEVPFCPAKFLQGCFCINTKRSVELYAHIRKSKVLRITYIMQT